MTNSEENWFDWPSLTVNDLKQCRKIDETNWACDIKAKFQDREIIKTINFKSIYIQGYIVQKPCDNVMILRDSTGKVKLSNCNNALTDCNSISKGIYCAVDGTLIREKGLPELSAHKIKRVQISNTSDELMFNFWPYEVQDFKLFALDLIKVNLEF